MGKKPDQSKTIPLKDICVATCNYARPHNARACVKRLRDLGLKEIIVWNNKAKPIPGASLNIMSPTNIGSIGRYYAGLQTKKPYILIIDDDHKLTKAGLDALRLWASKYPVVLQRGAVFKPPFKRYFARKVYRSHEIKKPQKVDLVLPFGGMILTPTLCRKMLKHWAWNFKKVVRPGFIATDLAVSCAILQLTGKHAVVVPAKKQGIEQLKDEAPNKALCHQKNAGKEKAKILKWMLKHGWKALLKKGS